MVSKCRGKTLGRVKSHTLIVQKGCEGYTEIGKSQSSAEEPWQRGWCLLLFTVQLVFHFNTVELALLMDSDIRCIWSLLSLQSALVLSVSKSMFNFGLIKNLTFIFFLGFFVIFCNCIIKLFLRNNA